MTQVLFLNNKGIIVPKLIEWFTWSHFDHVEVISPDGLNSASALEFHGVIERPIDTVLAKAKNYTIVEFPADPVKTYSFVLSQLGKSYDYASVFGIAFHKNWNEKNTWFCSDIIAAALASGGLQLFRDNYDRRITPEDLYKLNYKIVKEG
jgi:hypothetical protein